ncbi:MAG: twin-arginine translocase TatA/TatE family subunit [Pirellulales bacterium]
MFGNLTPSELLFFGVIALLLFGAKLPDVAKNLGGTYRELRKHLNEFQKEFQVSDRYDPPPKRVTVEQDESAPVQSSAPKFKPPPSDDSPSSEG